jgi:hypothetical protein
MEIMDDGGRMIRFDGEQLGSASTRERDSIRWSETRIWKTTGGKYIMQKVGRSLVFHATGGCKYGTEVYLGDMPCDYLPCPVCKPSKSEMYVKQENDRFTVHVSDSAEGIVESAKLQDDDGVWYTTRVDREALEQAANADDEMHEAYFVTVVE